MNFIRQRRRTDVSMNGVFNPVAESTKSIICMEDLSNEIFYDIFDYLDGCHLYEAFSNLNTRFQHLLINPYLLLKMNLSSKHRIILEHNCLNIINPNKFHILSLHLSNATATEYFLRYVPVNSLFNHLQSLAIHGIIEHKLQLLLGQLAFLPHFYSLIIVVNGCLESFDNIYQSIFRLPFLKYNKLSYGPWRVPLILPFASDEQFSSIEHLNIDIDLDTNELISILPYTPELCHLTCRCLFNSSFNIGNAITILLPHLTHIYLDRCQLQFNELEILMKIISSPLQVLRFTTSENSEYLAADRWQKLILEYLPQLRKFEFAYEEKIANNFQLNLYHQQIKQFTSSFWIERQWYFELEMDAPRFNDHRMIYLIHSSRKNWYHLCQDIELHARNRCDFDRYQSLIKNISCIFQLVKITCLNIDLSYSSVDLLLDFINHLPNLHSLNVSCLTLLKSDISTNEVSTKNQITKVNLEKMIAFEQVQFLVDLCPYIEYLQVECTKNFNLEMFKRFVLMKRNNTKKILKLHTLCLCIATADEKMIENFQTMIDLEKLLSDYSMKRVLDRIYFQWK